MLVFPTARGNMSILIGQSLFNYKTSHIYADCFHISLEVAKLLRLVIFLPVLFYLN